MKGLTILSGAGINHCLASECPAAQGMVDFTYQKISESVYQRVSPEIQALFSAESFDYILGGLMTINLAIEKTRQDLKRFEMNDDAFVTLFRQNELQSSIVQALDQIEAQLTLSLPQMINVIRQFSPAVDHLHDSFDVINYFTVNFDGIFDHVLYGERYSRRATTTDFWTWNGTLDPKLRRKVRIMHLHGDLRYKPFKATSYITPPYKWPVLVVGDGDVKRGIIASNEALHFYFDVLRQVMKPVETGEWNRTLLIVGFGFRQEDEHIVARIKHAADTGAFQRIVLYDVVDRLADLQIESAYEWIHPRQQGLVDLLSAL